MYKAKASLPTVPVGNQTAHMIFTMAEERCRRPATAIYAYGATAICYVKITKKRYTGLPVQRMLKLVDHGRDLEALVQDGALALQPDVLGPFHKPRQVPSRLDVLSYRKVTFHEVVQD